MIGVETKMFLYTTFLHLVDVRYSYIELRKAFVNYDLSDFKALFSYM